MSGYNNIRLLDQGIDRLLSLEHIPLIDDIKTILKHLYTRIFISEVLNRIDDGVDRFVKKHEDNLNNYGRFYEYSNIEVSIRCCTISRHGNMMMVTGSLVSHYLEVYHQQSGWTISRLIGQEHICYMTIGINYELAEWNIAIHNY